MGEAKRRRARRARQLREIEVARAHLNVARARGVERIIGPTGIDALDGQTDEFLAISEAFIRAKLEGRAPTREEAERAAAFYGLKPPERRGVGP